MKKFLFLFILLFAVSFPGFSQKRLKPSPEPRTNAHQVSRIMASQLRLNESEYIMLRTLNEERQLQTAEISVEYRYDLEMRDAKLKAVEDKFERQVVAFLSASQLDAYILFKQSSPVVYTTYLTDETRLDKK
jgi:hypothetical protein